MTQEQPRKSIADTHKDLVSLKCYLLTLVDRKEEQEVIELVRRDIELAEQQLTPDEKQSVEIETLLRHARTSIENVKRDMGA